MKILREYVMYFDYAIGGGFFKSVHIMFLVFTRLDYLLRRSILELHNSSSCVMLKQSVQKEKHIVKRGA